MQIDAFIEAQKLATSVEVIFAILIGLLLGVFFGAIPGLTTTFDNLETVF